MPNETTDALHEALETLRWARVFVTSRQKVKHPEGTDLYDETIAKLEATLSKAP